MIDIRRHGFFVKLFSSAVLMQAMLSGASLCVGMLLIRHAANAQYGYYVLISTAILLMTSIQGAYIQPSLVIKLTRSSDDASERGNFVGSLYRGQQKLLPILAVVAIVITIVARLVDFFDSVEMWVTIAGIFAITANLIREFFRMVLLAYRRPGDVIRSDIWYVAVLISGAAISIFLPIPAAATAIALALAAVISGGYQRRALYRFEPWNPKASTGALKEIYRTGIWAVVGAVIHWTFTQGYNYLVVGVLTVDDVAAIAATRILMMPINLISTGVSSFMFPTVAGWLNNHKTTVVLKRIYLFTTGLVLMAVVYLMIVWEVRDWIFSTLLKKHFEHRDMLLFLWSMICIVMVLRDQLGYTLIAHAHFRRLSVVAAVSAVLAITTSYFLMLSMGQPGALIGILVGEGSSVICVIVMAILDARHESPMTVTQ